MGGVDGDGHGSHGGHGALQVALAAGADVHEARARGSHAGGSEATRSVLGDERPSVSR